MMFKTIIFSIFRRIKSILFLRYLFNKIDKVKNENDFIYKSNIYGIDLVLNLKNVVDKYFYLGLFERETLDFLRSKLKDDIVFFDIGANIGIFSLFVAKHSNNSRIHAFEPAEEPFLQFEKSLLLNKFNNIKLNKFGVSDSIGNISFNICSDNAYNSIGDAPLDKIVDRINIPVVSINDYCQKNNISKIDIIKIDTEGAEYKVLLGGDRIFEKFDGPIILMEFNRNVINGFVNSAEDILILLKKWNYEIYDLKLGVIRKFNEKTSNSGDIICIKKQLN